MDMDELTKKMFTLFQRFHKLKEIPVFPNGLSRAEFSILINLYKEKGEPQTVSGIAKKLQISSPAVSRSLRVLEQRGIIRREVDVNDRRLTVVQITESGKTLLHQAEKNTCELMESVLKQMDPEEVKHLYEYLEQFFNIMQMEMKRIKQEKEKGTNGNE